jgi:hypothetical protein
MRLCGWCRGPIAASTRADAVFCKKPCRQAAHRTKIRRAELERGASPMHFAYADPPYPGRARRYYGEHPDYAGEVDHAALLERLQRYDGWALSTSSDSLAGVLSLCVAQDLRVEVAAWCRAARPHPIARVVTAWEPVVYIPGRRARQSGAAVADALVGVAARARATLPAYVIGAKPPEFCRWVFELLGATIGDELDDLFPGSGIVARSWSWYQGRDPSRAAAAPASRGSVACGSGDQMSWLAS